MNKKLLIAIVDDDLIFQFIAERLIESLILNTKQLYSRMEKKFNRNEPDTLPDIIFLLICQCYEWLVFK
jgi:hypothetical protein